MLHYGCTVVEGSSWKKMLIFSRLKGLVESINSHNKGNFRILHILIIPHEAVRKF